LADCALIVHRERQYKRKIKLWDLRKNATVGDYSHIDQLRQSRSRVPLGDVFLSRGIPITNKKIRRYMRYKGQKAPEPTEGQVSPPPDRTRGSSSRPAQDDDEAAHPWSLSTADKTSSEPDKGRSSSRLAELLRQCTQGEDEIANLKLQMQVRQDQVADLKRRIQLETAISKLPQKDPAPEILAVREANSKQEWRAVTIRDFRPVGGPRPAAAPAHTHLSVDDTIFSPGARVGDKVKRKAVIARQFRALYPWVKSIATVAAAVGNELDDPHRDLGHSSLAMWTPMSMPMPGRTGLTHGDTIRWGGHL
jgi:hypothetical protein